MRNIMIHYNNHNNACTGKKTQSLPSADSKEELANKIADFFANKIKKIVSSFVISESLHVQSSQEFTGTPFTKFQPISEDKLRGSYYEWEFQVLPPRPYTDISVERSFRSRSTDIYHLGE